MPDERLPDIEFNVVLTGKEMTHLILVLGHHHQNTNSPSSIILRDKLTRTTEDFKNVRR